MADTFNEEDIRRTKRLFPHAETELRPINPTTGKVEGSYFVSTEDTLVEVCKRFVGKSNIYFGFNERRAGGTEGKDVIKMNGLLMDFDPVRKPISFAKEASTDEEMNFAIAKAREAWEWLKNEKHTQPSALIATGNGAQIWIVFTEPINVTDDNRETLAANLKALGQGWKARFSTSDVEFDTSVFELARITKVAGTLSIKGSNTQERPHRLAKFLEYREPQPNEELKAALLKPVNFTRNQDTTDSYVLPAPLRKEIESRCPAKIPQGMRHEAFASLYGFFSEQGYSRSQIRDVLLWVNANLCDPPKEQAQVDKEFGQFVESFGVKAEDTKAWEKGKQEYEKYIANGACKIPDFICNDPDGIGMRSYAERFESLYELDLVFGAWARVIRSKVKKGDEKAKAIAEKKIAKMQSLLIRIYIPRYFVRKCCALNVIEHNAVWTKKHGIWEEGAYELRQEMEATFRLPKTSLFLCLKTRNMILKHVQDFAFKRLIELQTSDYSLLPLANGVLDFKTKMLRDYRDDDNFTSKLKVHYDPNAKCPKFEQFLNDICKDAKGVLKPKMRKSLIQLIGYCLHRSYQIQQLFFQIGGGANGKGTYNGVIYALLGAENTCSRSVYALSSNRFASADLFGKYANISNELTSGELKNFDMVKALCSGTDGINAEHKGKDSFEYLNHAKLIFATNEPPITRDRTVGFWRRLNLNFFERQFMGVDDKKELKDEVKSPEELSGVLNLALAELYEMLDEKGAIKSNAEFANVEDVDTTRELYDRASDSIRSFVWDCLELTEDEDDTIDRQRMVRAYSLYCKQRKLTKKTEDKFFKDFKNITDGIVGTKKGKTAGGARVNQYWGATVKEEAKEYFVQGVH